MPPAFCGLQLVIQKALHRLFPFLVPKPAFLQLDAPDLPYTALQRRMQQEAAFFKAATILLGVVVIGWLGVSFKAVAIAVGAGFF